MKKNILIIIIGLIIILLFIGILLSKENEKSDNILNNNIITQNNSKEIKQVTSATTFFTVQSCANKYFNYIVEKDKESVYKLLDEEYIKKFNITEENVLEKVEKIENNIIFKAEKVSYIEGENQTYYVLGSMEKEDSEDIILLDGKYSLTIKLDTENMIFSVIPYGYGGVYYEKDN